MTWVILAIFSVALFCLSARCFVGAITEPRVVFRTADYNVMALKVRRWYRIMAWGTVTFVLLAMLMSAFIQSVSEVL